MLVFIFFDPDTPQSLSKNDREWEKKTKGQEDFKECLELIQHWEFRIRSNEPAAVIYYISRFLQLQELFSSSPSTLWEILAILKRISMSTFAICNVWFSL